MERAETADQLICGCAELTAEGIGALVARYPAASFDQFLERSGAGRECTACMLDLEYLFTEAPRDATASARLAHNDDVAPAVSLKQRLYAMLDSVPIKVPINVTNCMPVFYGAGIQQYLWMANHSLLYDGVGGEHPFRVRYRLRDGAGREFHRARLTLEPDSELRQDLSACFPASDALAVGSITLDRFAAAPTVRGTTRPQIEIVGPHSATSLHFQAPGHDQIRSSRTPWRPDVECGLFTIVNTGPRPYHVAFSYWVNHDLGAPQLGAAQCTVPPRGAMLHEVELSDKAQAVLDSSLLQIRWQARGAGKLHFVCLTRDGERLSIDHL
jgi:bacterioferritin-associated ferredoxin